MDLSSTSYMHVAYMSNCIHVGQTTSLPIKCMLLTCKVQCCMHSKLTYRNSLFFHCKNIFVRSKWTKIIFTNLIIQRKNFERIFRTTTWRRVVWCERKSKASYQVVFECLWAPCQSCPFEGTSSLSTGCPIQGDPYLASISSTAIATANCKVEKVTGESAKQTKKRGSYKK